MPARALDKKYLKTTSPEPLVQIQNINSYMKRVVTLISVNIVYIYKPSLTSLCPGISQQETTGPRSAVGNVSGNICESDCRARGRLFKLAHEKVWLG